MNEKEFEKKVNQELRTLNSEQVVQFAWRCGVRALPFLGSAGSFNFWKEKDRQEYIYRIFYALDIASAADAANADVALSATLSATRYARSAAAAARYAVLSARLMPPALPPSLPPAPPPPHTTQT